MRLIRQAGTAGNKDVILAHRKGISWPHRKLVKKSETLRNAASVT
jgi:hypothetical protein